MQDLIKDTIYKNDKKVFIEKEILEDNLVSATPNIDKNNINTELEENLKNNNKKRKGGKTFKFLGIILLLIGVGGLPFGALGGASIFLIIIGIIMYFTFK